MTYALAASAPSARGEAVINVYCTIKVNRVAFGMHAPKPSYYVSMGEIVSQEIACCSTRREADDLARKLRAVFREAAGKKAGRE